MLDKAKEAKSRELLPIDRRMAESLRELSAALLDFPHADGLAAQAALVEGGFLLEPTAYSTYFQLLRALQANDQQALRALIATLALTPTSNGVAIRMLGFDAFGRKGVRTTRDDFASDSLLHTQMGVIPAGAGPRMHRKLTGALDLIADLSSQAWQDITDVTTEIVAAYGTMRGLTTFDGCSSLERYGSILINMRRDRTPLGLAETLVHESAHGLLFALSCNEHRVLNPPSERHASPLRHDPRPLDGIYHAVFVLARMFAFVSDVAQSPNTTQTMRAEAQRRMDARRKNFLDGYAVLQEHARLTDIGQSLLDDAYARVMMA